jgi:Tfp pilus assembly protein FimT
MHHKGRFNNGIGVLEIILAIGICALMFGIVITMYSAFHAQQDVIGNGAEVASLLNKARYETLSERAGASYGVFFSGNQAVLYKNSYTPGSVDNTVLTIDQGMSMSEYLSSGTTTVSFNKITGTANATGTIVLISTSTPSNMSSTTITVYSTGVIDQN